MTFLSAGWQAAFAKWNEGQKDRLKQVSTVVDAHKARAAEVNAAMEQHREISTLKPVPKGKKEQPLELHPDDFVTIKAHKIADVAEEPMPTVTKVTVDHGTPVDVVKPVNDKTSDSYAAHIEVRPVCHGITGVIADFLLMFMQVPPSLGVTHVLC